MVWPIRWVKKMDQIKEANAGIAIAIARLDDEDMVHFLPQKSAKIKRAGYKLLKYKILIKITILQIMHKNRTPGVRFRFLIPIVRNTNTRGKIK